MIDIHTFRNKEEALAEARKVFSATLAEHKYRQVLLLLSGGSAFGVLSGIATDALPANLMIGMLDDRWSSDLAANNFAQFTETEFYALAKTAGATFVDSRVDVELESLPTYAARLDTALHTWRAANPTGRIVITQGIGPDGHTAGIMPYPEDPALFKTFFEERGRWVVGYDAGEKTRYPLRATVSLPFLREEVDFSLVFVVGAEKKQTIENMLAETGALAATPARIVHEMKKVFIVTDVSFE